MTQMNPDPGPSKLIEKSQNSFKLVKQFSYRFQKGRNLIDKANTNWCNIAHFSLSRRMSLKFSYRITLEKALLDWSNSPQLTRQQFCFN